MYPAVRVERATVLDEATLSEPVHKKVDARSCSADHNCQRTLRYSRESVELALNPVPCEQKENAGQSPLAALRNLVDEILLDSNIAREQIRSPYCIGRSRVPD